MKKAQLFILLLCFVHFCHAQDITGKWYGNPKVGSVGLSIVFDIRESDGIYSGFMLSPDQSNQEIEIDKISFAGDTLLVEIKRLDFIYKGILNDQKEFKGIFIQKSGIFEMNLSREAVIRKRPQEPKPPYPYTVEEVSFHNDKDKIVLAGTFTVPSQVGKYPAVVLVTGSGPQDRDEGLLGHKPFFVLADHLTRQGFAVLRFDDRGVGESQGVYETAGLLDHAEDTRWAIEYLKSREDVDSQHIGVVGHSMGGTISFIMAAENRIAFIVSLAGMAINGSELLWQQREGLLRASGASENFITTYNELLRKAEILALRNDDKKTLTGQLAELFQGTPLAGREEPTALQLLNPELRSILACNPQEYLLEVSCPVLALNGEKDLQVPAAPNLQAIKENVSRKGNERAVTKIYPGLNHLFQHAETGLPAEYTQIEETISPEVLNDISQWMIEIR